MRANRRCVYTGIGVAAGLFLGFQLVFFLLMRVPGNVQTRIQPRDSLVVMDMEVECRASDCEDDENRPFHPRNIGRHDKGKVQLDTDHKGVDKDKQRRNNENINVPRGVLRSDAYKFLPDSDGQFTCLYSQEKIPIEQLNDDYCDCHDASDEPGTSACSPYSKFYCSNQEARHDPIFSSRVNDGICDCCDGSDEFQGKILDGLPLSDTIRRVPCADICRAVMNAAHDQETMKVQGAKLKQQYIEAGKSQNLNKQYGEDGAFYLLSESCYYKTVSKYDYTVCPFKEVFQGNDRDSIVIGKTPRWLSHGAEGKHVLMMEGGSSMNCPNPPRSTRIEFECGLDDDIIRIEEAETCRYTVRFTTPAAC